ncbi:ribosomal RNA-processing protein 7 [Cyclospora cayetanensis]|uniref:Ribosomal RNA-processing protein 7 n=1 Tax=Cyclospora cayetanensis TaxID=88456 RepID=A0A1D3D5L3_9EIME|nr:ribosomal RNA-processing protein 7 [Cyclospora cayetanensis]
MKLCSFRALRVGALPGSPFGYEVLIRPAEVAPIRGAAMAAAMAAAGDPAEAAEAAAAAAEEGRALFVSCVRLLHIVFEEAAAVDRALAAAVPLDRRPCSTPTEGPQGAPPCGWGLNDVAGQLRAGCCGAPAKEGPLQWAIEAAALFKPPRKLKAEVDAFMRNYDLEKDLKKQQRKVAVVDEDGFILVQG